MFSSIVNLIFFVVLGSSLTTTGTALRIEIRPGQYTEESSGPINVSCVLDRKDADVYDVFMMQVLKDDDPPLLTLRAAGLSLGIHVSDSAKYQTEGLISSVCGKSYLRLSILSPSESDEGRYTCKVFYSDLIGYSKEQRAGGNVTVDRIDLNDVVRQLMDQVSALNNQNMALNKQVSALNKQVSVLNNQDTDLSNQVSALITKVLEQQAALDDVNQRDQTTIITDLTEKVTYETIAFTATIQSQIDISRGDTVVFPDVVMNQGQCYDNNTGIFTTPRAGLYTFHLSMLTQCPSCEVAVSLTVNDKTLSSLYARDPGSRDHSSKTFILELEKGDTVKVVAYGTTRLYPDGWNVFSGYLVKPR